MSKWRRKAKPTLPQRLLVPLLMLIFHFTPSAAIDLLFNGFEDSDLDLYANATLEPFPSSAAPAQRRHRRRYLSLTANDTFSLGRALLPSPVTTKSSNSSEALPFATSFLFSIAPVPQALPGHGIAFLFAPEPGTLGATSSQHLGLFNLSTDGDPSDRVLAVEFDVFQNEEFHDINANHVGVDRNSLTSVAAAPAGYWPDDEGGAAASFVGLTLNDGTNYQAWVDYAGGRLNVTMAPVSFGRKPRRPLLSVKIDLSDLFLDKMYVGFCASTGRLVEHHRVLGWSFSNSNFSAADGLITADLPNFIPPATEFDANSRRHLVIGLSVAATVVLLSVLGIWMAIRRRRTRKRSTEEVCEETIEDWESEYWPHRIAYLEIVTATEGFSNSNLIGRGGNGRVYKGVLGGAQVAVKLFSQTNEEEAKQFAAEVSTLGRLKHRNLVGLRGWCRARRTAAAGGGDAMILVYDYMENGSLDQWIFGAGQPLDWGSSVRILRDVAAAALYLHEGWGEAVVLHRDIKASNVMLDGAMTGRLGDFGLARANQRGRALGTTRVVGSAGYLAPEVVRTGRATTATDVYAFGVLALEVASWRRAAEEGLPPLVAWAREAAAMGGEAAVVDRRVRASEGYDEGEAARVVAVGLACTRDPAAARPTMRRVVRMLEASEDETADGGDDSTSLLLNARLNPAMRSDKACASAAAQRQPHRHLTFAELRHSLSCSTSLSGSDVILEGR
ncbi:unnamed protein product [Musa hybrid cultivar]